MRIPKLFVAALMLLTLPRIVAAQTSWDFFLTGTIVQWFAPVAGMYTIEAVGAQGAGNLTGRTMRTGGRGALVRSTFALDAGAQLQLAVGGAGISDGCSGGGGGGSFIASLANVPMLIAGGGGGLRSGAASNGSDASITQFSSSSSGSGSSVLATFRTDRAGLGGVVSASSWGSAGAGFYSDGQFEATGATPARSWANGLEGGNTGNPIRLATGGFGAGGSGNGFCGGGGGGGYSGGDGGWVAGGGASYLSGTDQYAERGVGTGNGRITITASSVVSTVPEPATNVLLAMGLVALGFVRARKRGQKPAQH